MRLKRPKNSYRWQPELSTSVIYWSLTFCLFFSSIAFFLEKISLNIFSIFSFAFFVVLLYLGFQRYFQLTDSHLFIHCLLKKKQIVVQLENIKKISVGSYGLAISEVFPDGKEKVFKVIMTKKEKQKFVKDVDQKKVFKGCIEEIKESAE